MTELLDAIYGDRQKKKDTPKKSKKKTETDKKNLSIKKFDFNGMIINYPDTTDEWIIIQENLISDQYHKLNPQPDDVIIDIGANIGTFALRYAQLCKRVVAFEPEPYNFALLERNIKENGITNIIAVNSPVSYHDKTMTLNIARNLSGHSLRATQNAIGIKVKAAEINTVIREYQPNKIKMDAEYSEYDIIPAMSNESFDQIESMVIEFHFSRGFEKFLPGYRQCLDILKKEFSYTDCDKFKSQSKIWVTLEYFSKKH